MRDQLRRIVSDLRRTVRAEGELPGGTVPVVPPAAPAAGKVLARVEAGVRACERCPLHRTRNLAVPGEGDARAPLMLIGEAPGADEDRQGRPFVGRAGQLLTKMLEAIHVPREEAFIGNILKCRPPGNRDPQPDEAVACRPWLDAQIAAIRPKVIMTLGRHSTQLLLGTTQGIMKLRGIPRPFEHSGGRTTVVPTLHPAYLLRNRSAKREAWEDLKLVHRLLRRTTGDWPPPM